MSVSRRLFLQGAGSALALAASRRARAATALTARKIDDKTYKVLEIHLCGGLSHRESFWVERPDAHPVKRVLHDLDPMTDPFVHPDQAPPSYTAWIPAKREYEDPAYEVGHSPGGSAIHLGPCGKPFTTPCDKINGPLLSRLRVVATGETNDTHEIAQRYVLQGQLSNSNRAAGTGAPIYAQTGQPSFVFYHSATLISRLASEASAATGFHGGETAPILVPFDSPDIVDLLSKPRVPSRDALSTLYDERYESGLTFGKSHERARSVALDRYLGSIDFAFRGAEFTVALAELSASTADVIWDNGTRRAIRASAKLLASGLSSYCCVCDRGVGGFDKGYDLHQNNIDDNTEHAGRNTASLLNVLRTIREEVDAGTLDLDTTLVVFSTEFGREYVTDYGSEHGSHGFATALLGGPIALGAGGVVGDLVFDDVDDDAAVEVSPAATATGGLGGGGGGGIRPTDLRAAILLAAGIHPFQEDKVFEVSESSNPAGTDPDIAADNLANLVFGV